MSRTEPHNNGSDKRKRDDGNLSDALLRRSKKGRRKAKGAAAQQPPPAEVLANPDEYVRVVPVPRGKRDVPENEPAEVSLSRTDKSAQLQLSSDQLEVTGHKGFRSARATHGVYEGTWFCEVVVKHLGSTGHCRLGWCTRKAELHAPVGFDKFGFAYRDLEGSKYHKALREPYGEAYSEGDVIGLFIHLPKTDNAPQQHQKEVVRWKGHWYHIDEPEPEPEPLPGSVVAFSKNGVLQGSAFTDIPLEAYFPAAALFTLPEQAEGATVKFNFGPTFRHPPPDVEGCPAARPFCEVPQSRPKPEAAEKKAEPDAAS